MSSERPKCPKCKVIGPKNGKTKAGKQRYLCKTCGRTFTGGLHGSLPKGDKAKTAAENYRAWYARQTPEKKKEINRKRNEARKRRKARLKAAAEKE